MKEERKKEHGRGAKEEGNALKKWIKKPRSKLVYGLQPLQSWSPFKLRTHLYN
jgi:hypothetical protein